VAATKADKLSRNELARQESRIRGTVGGNIPVVLFSSHNGMGKKELWKEIKSLIE
jgi:GTP-binding protein EngB required for normal cell division